MAKMAQFKSEWRNTSPGMAGAVQFDEDGKQQGIVVRPGESVFFTEEERIATANAPRLDDDNPFTNGTFELLTPAAEIKNRRHIGADSLPEATQPEPEAETAVEPSQEEEEAEVEAKAAAKREEQENIARAAQAQKARNAAEAAREAGVAQEEAMGTPSASKEATASSPAQGSRPASEVVATPPAKE